MIRGEPTPEELAVLTALVSSASVEEQSTDDPAPRGFWGDPRPGGWNDPRRFLGGPLRPGPRAWRASLFD